jgi:hypothetical protein
MTEPLSADKLPGERSNYTENQWQAIRRTLPAACDQAQVREEIEIAVSQYKIASAFATGPQNNPAQKAKAWSRVRSNTEKLIAAINVADDPTYPQLMGSTEDEWMREHLADHLANRTDALIAARKDEHAKLLAHFLNTKKRASVLEDLYRHLARARSGRKNPDRKFLYGHVVRIWTEVVGERVKWSRSSTGEPTGRLVEFFIACVAPVLGNRTPSREGIKDILERERDARGV